MVLRRQETKVFAKILTQYESKNASIAFRKSWKIIYFNIIPFILYQNVVVEQVKWFKIIIADSLPTTELLKWFFFQSLEVLSWKAVAWVCPSSWKTPHQSFSTLVQFYKISKEGSLLPSLLYNSCSLSHDTPRCDTVSFRMCHSYTASCISTTCLNTHECLCKSIQIALTK